MEYISSDTNVWLDFKTIGFLELSFRLPYAYLMNSDAIHDELLSPVDLSESLIKLGLIETDLSIEEFYLASEYMEKYKKPSKYDCIALAIAKTRQIKLMTGDMALRKAALQEGVQVIGTIGILDELKNNALLQPEEYQMCLRMLHHYNGKKVRLPEHELLLRLNETESK